MPPPQLSLTLSLADQDFARTKSVGIFNLATALARRLAERGEISRLTVLTNATLDRAAGLPDGVKRQRHDLAVRGRLARLWWDQWAVYSAARRTGDDWLLLPKGFASFLRTPPLKLAVYVHDAMHDFYQRTHPGAITWPEQAYFSRALRASLRHARMVFTNTEFTAREAGRLAAQAGLPPPPVAVAGIGFEAPAHAPTGERRGIVVLASPFPHKRTRLAVEWLARWQRASGFTGEVDWVGGLPEGLDLPDLPGWRRHNRLPEAEYRRLLAQARALVFFSEYEGFGMPPVEAALAGACPAFSALPATREVMGECGFAFANSDYESFRAAMNSALGAAADTVAGWGEELLARHNWNRVLDRIVVGLQAAQAETPLKPARP